MAYVIEHPLKWPVGQPRTLIAQRKPNGAWKKTFAQAASMLSDELAKMGVPTFAITLNPDHLTKQDPGVAVHWSAKMEEDYGWQSVLEIDNPLPTMDEIKEAYRRKGLPHHPDRGGDPVTFEPYRVAYEQAKAWINNTHTDKYQYSIACDRYTEPRLNLAAIKLAIDGLRKLDRVGIPGIVEKAFSGFKQALPQNASPSSQQEVA